MKGGAALTIALVLIGSCHDAATSPSNPGTQQSTSGRLGSNGSASTLLACPTGQTQSASTDIGPLGGTLSLGATTVTVPLGALLDQTKVELSVPEGNYVEVDLTVNGGQHITFLQPVIVTIDYSRCTRNDVLSKALTVWNIEPSTKSLLENMGGIDNKLTQTITFFTPHFSGFAIAY